MKEPVNDPWRLLDNCNRMIGAVHVAMKLREAEIDRIEALTDRAAFVTRLLFVIGLLVLLTPSPIARSPAVQHITSLVLILVWLFGWILSAHGRMQTRRLLRDRHNFVMQARFLLVHIDLMLGDKSTGPDDESMRATLRERAGLLAGLIDGTPWEAR